MAGLDAEPRVYTIPPSANFLATLVDALVSGRLVPGPPLRDDPLALADATIFVPTRRAGRALAAAIAEAAGGRATLLPSIRPLGDVEEDLLALSPAGAALADLPPAVDPLERRVVMTRLVLGWARALSPDLRKLLPGEEVLVPTSPADAARLADDLLALVDQVTTEETEWSRLGTIVPADLARFWQVTLAFLEIATAAWPQILEERGRIDPVVRRLRLIDAEAARFTARPPAGPVIAAGSTGSVPATARLMAAIARLPRGAVVLPGLDHALDEETWTAIGDGDGTPSHPQFGLARLLPRLGVTRADVVPLVAPSLPLRGALASEAFRPAETTERWAGIEGRFGTPAAVAEGLAGLGLVEAANEREEAAAIALALREALADGATRAALVAPDRTIARRVAAELGRWGIAVEDSAGMPAGTTPLGVLARLVATVGIAGDDPAALLALLKHPLADFGLSREARIAAVDRLERSVLRGPRLAPGVAALAESARHRAAALAAMRRGEGLEDAIDLADRLVSALSPLTDLAAASSTSVAALAAAHAAALAAVRTPADGEEPAAATAEAHFAGCFERLSAGDAEALAIAPRDWPGLFDVLAGGAAVRPAGMRPGRVEIWGPLEARLQAADLVVLAGLNEATWPQVVGVDPWLTRPMRSALGLEAPERRVGLSAHDVEMALGAPRVLLTRSARAGGAPTVASRFLQRLKAVAGEAGRAAMAAEGARHFARARRLDRPDGPPVAAPRPEPRPPLAARPRGLSVTEIETLIRDPYAIYARRVLGLKPLDPVAADPGAADRGNIVHAALAAFLKPHMGPFDATAVAALVAAGRQAFAAVADYPEVTALWWPRFLRIAEAFVAREAERPAARKHHVEMSGGLAIPAPGGPFTLNGRADRIDETADGLFIVDYKTGGAPSIREVASLLAPQLPLEAAMVRRGGFPGVPADEPIAALAYIRLRGLADPVEEVTIAPGFDKDDADRGPDSLAAEAYDRLAALIARYDDPANGYLSRARVAFEQAMDAPYDHLARAREWTVGGGGEA
jgi:ATP-dependent helicase/nuclease subunit B